MSLTSSLRCDADGPTCFTLKSAGILETQYKQTQPLVKTWTIKREQPLNPRLVVELQRLFAKRQSVIDEDDRAVTWLNRQVCALHAYSS